MAERAPPVPSLQPFFCTETPPIPQLPQTLSLFTTLQRRSTRKRSVNNLVNPCRSSISFTPPQPPTALRGIAFWKNRSTPPPLCLRGRHLGELAQRTLTKKILLKPELLNHYGNAWDSLVIYHCGLRSILSTLRHGRPIVVFTVLLSSCLTSASSPTRSSIPFSHLISLSFVSQFVGYKYAGKQDL